MTKKVLMIIASLMLVFPMFKAIGAHAAEPTISVSLYNDIGYKTSLTVKTTGTYTSNQRISGGDRFGVANNVAEQEWSNPDTVILTNYLAFADALAATPLAYKLHAPILLTHPDSLTPDTKQKLDDLNPKTVIIVGGTGSISSDEETALKNSGYIVNRIDGHDRFIVAQNIASRLGGTDTAIVANGFVFADAMSIAPYAAQHGYPILLTANDYVPSPTQQALRSKSIVVGGTASVNQNVYNAVKGVQRIDGHDRYEVAANVIRNLPVDATHAFIATGDTFADALTGSVLAAEQGDPILLTQPDQLPPETAKIIADKGIRGFTILGGPASVSGNVVQQLPSEMKLSPNINYTVKSESGWINFYNGSQKIGSFPTNAYVSPYEYDSDSTIIVNGDVYKGKMKFFNESGFVRPVNMDIPYSDYLKGVVPHESPAYWPIQALKAQAVAARTFSYDDLFDTVKDDQSYQRYGGYDWTTSAYDNSNKAVEDTKGQVLEYNGDLIDALYSSSNGGKVLSNTNAWGNSRLPYSTLTDDPYDLNNDPNRDWIFTIHKTQINLNDGRDLTKPDTWWGTSNEVDSTIMNNIKSWMLSNDSNLKGKEIKIVTIPTLSFSLPGSYGPDDTIMGTLDVQYIVKNADGTYQMGQDGNIAVLTNHYNERAYNTRSKIGGTIMKSPYITSEALPSDSNDNCYVVHGGGYGHGIGMSQYGAANRAAAGFNYQQILSFYYPGAVLTTK